MKDARGHGSNNRGSLVGGPTSAMLQPGRLGQDAARAAAHQMGVQEVGTKPAFTQQHFEMIAQTLAQHAAQVRTNPHAHDALVANFADKLSKTNPKFDKARFTRAAGGH